MSPTWRDRLQRTAAGAVKANFLNASIAVRGEFGRAIYWCELGHRVMIREALPWDQQAPRPWEETDDLFLMEWLARAEIHVATKIVEQAVQRTALDHRAHPIRDWLLSLTWDGQPRVDDWLISYLGAPENDYTRAVGRCFMLASVARAMRPGCKVDNVLILQSGQGTLKSSALRALFSPAWFADRMSDWSSKDALAELQGVWCFELAELDVLLRASPEKAKSFISSQVDRFRPPYGRRIVERPRGCIITGSTNSETFLSDPTGNRRFWPVKIKMAKIAEIQQDRAQLWAEAMDLYSLDEKWWITDEDLLDFAEKEQADRLMDDAWSTDVLDWANRQAAPFTTAELADHALKMPVRDITPREQSRLANILRTGGYTQKVTGTLPQDRRRRWVRGH